VTARSSIIPSESDENDLQLALNLSQLPADTSDDIGQVNELERRRVSRTAIENCLASLLMEMSLGEVPSTLS
jgi:hypothetical protein